MGVRLGQVEKRWVEGKGFTGIDKSSSHLLLSLCDLGQMSSLL